MRNFSRVFCSQCFFIVCNVIPNNLSSRHRTLYLVTMPFLSSVCEWIKINKTNEPKSISKWIMPVLNVISIFFRVFSHFSSKLKKRKFFFCLFSHFVCCYCSVVVYFVPKIVENECYTIHYIGLKQPKHRLLFYACLYDGLPSPKVTKKPSLFACLQRFSLSF